MARLQITSILETIGDYVLIKKGAEFPDYVAGQDVDLLVLDRKMALKALQEYHFKTTEGEFELRVTDDANHCHVDFQRNGAIEIRFDLIDGFSFFKNFSVRPHYLYKIFRDRKKVSVHSTAVLVPDIVDDLTLRYFEYLEYFDRNPDKVKHLDFVASAIDESVRERFFENTHHYIVFRPKRWDVANYPTLRPVLASRRSALNLLVMSIKYLIRTTLLSILGKARRLLAPSPL